MNIRSSIIGLFLLSALFVAGCGTADAPSENANAANTAPANTDSPLATGPAKTVETVNEAPTLTPSVNAYCEAMEKKDEAGLRRVYSSDSIQHFEKDMKETGDRTLVEYLAIDNVTTALCDVKNEEIKGDEATAILTTAGMPGGAKVIFVREGGEWKLTNRVPDLDKK
jgi:hypothetical protein